MMTTTTADATKAVTTLELRGDREIVITRTFRAPPRIVFEAWTRPEHVRRWWAPCGLVEMVHCEADVRVGGEYRYVTRSEGQDYAFSGVYRDITPPSRLVYTQVFEPMAHAGAVIVTVTFDDAPGGRTRMVSHEVYPSPEAREGALASGMEHGLRITMDQLDDLAASLA